MNRRGFLSLLGQGAVGAATVAAVVTMQQVEEVQPASLAAIEPGTRHFAVFMDIQGRPRKTMMVDNLPQEVQIQHAAGTTAFRLVSVNRFDGRTIEGLARYIQFPTADHKGPIPASWGFVKLGF